VLPGGWTLPPPQLGSTITTLLVDQLVNVSRFHILDGQWLVPEGETGGRFQLDRLRAAAAERQVDYLVLGTLTGFATESHARRGFGLWPRPFVAGGLSRQETRTSVDLSLRIVDVRTGEIVRSTTAHGIGKRRTRSLGLLAVVTGLPVGGGGGSRPSNSRDAMLDEAIQDAVKSAAHALTTTAAGLR
jgi:curli biogenesis system outer membrane secretion channel CsgG